MNSLHIARFVAPIIIAHNGVLCAFLSSCTHAVYVSNTFAVLSDAASINRPLFAAASRSAVQQTKMA